MCRRRLRSRLAVRKLLHGDKKPGHALRAARRKPRNLLDAIEASNDGTRRDETLRHFASELLQFGLVRSDDLFISSYDIGADLEHFVFCGRR